MIYWTPEIEHYWIHNQWLGFEQGTPETEDKKIRRQPYCLAKDAKRLTVFRGLTT
jgi:hypothetical protein